MNSWAEETVVAMQGTSLTAWVEGTQSSKCRCWCMPKEKMIEFFSVVGITMRDIGGPEGVAALVMEGRLDDDGTGVISDAEFSAHNDECTAAVQAAADFIMNTGVVSTLLVTIQFAAIVMESEPHPFLVAWLTRALKFSIDQDDYYTMGSVTAYEPIEVNVVVLALQQLSTLWMLKSIFSNLLVIMLSTKGYGQLTWWSVDLETKLWFMRGSNIASFQGAANFLVPQFCFSLVPYLLLTRGPIVAIAMFLGAHWLKKSYREYDSTGCAAVLSYTALKVMKEKGEYQQKYQAKTQQADSTAET